MTTRAKTKTPKTPLRRDEVKGKSEEKELESIKVSYNGKEYTVKFPKDANSKDICQNIKRETGVKGAFYVHSGEQSNSYLHSSSVTSRNLARLAGKTLEVRGGNDFNKGGDPIWYYNSQKLKPEVQEKYREMDWIPFDNPP